MTVVKVNCNIERVIPLLDIHWIGYNVQWVDATSIYDVMCIDEAYVTCMHLRFIKRGPAVPHTVLLVPIKYRSCFCAFSILSEHP